MNKIRKFLMDEIFIISVLLLFIISGAKAANFTSAGTGDWNLGAT